MKGKIPMEKPFDFGAVLKNLRKQKGYTQKRLAEVLNVSETTISKYESNTAVPPFETVRAIAAWFNISIDSLAGNEAPHSIPLYGLTESQIEIVKELVRIYNKRNNLSENRLSVKEYELLGRIMESLV